MYRQSSGQKGNLWGQPCCVTVAACLFARFVSVRGQNAGQICLAHWWLASQEGVGSIRVQSNILKEEEHFENDTAGRSCLNTVNCK